MVVREGGGGDAGCADLDEAIPNVVASRLIEVVLVRVVALVVFLIRGRFQGFLLGLGSARAAAVPSFTAPRAPLIDGGAVDEEAATYAIG